MPGLGPGTPLRRGVSAAEVPAAGVDAASEALSTDEGGRGSSADEEAGDEGSWILTGESVLLTLPRLLFLSFPSGGGVTNWLSRSVDSLRTTILLEGPDRLERPFAVELAELAAGMVDRLDVEIVGVDEVGWVAPSDDAKRSWEESKIRRDPPIGLFRQRPQPNAGEGEVCED